MKLEIHEALQIKRILMPFSEQKLPIKTSYKMVKLISNIEKEGVIFDEQLQKLLAEYAVKNEEGKIDFVDGGIAIEKGKEDEFYKEFDELNSIEIEIADIKFTVEELSNLEISPKDLYQLDKIIEE